MDATVAEILLRTNAVSISPSHPFKYSSGLLSPIYTDCRVLSSYPNERRIIVDKLISFVADKIGIENIDVIVGTSHSGISLATYLAQRLTLPMAYTRPSSKNHGKKNQIEGVLENSQRVLLLSDIMSTEQDIATAVDAIKNVGAKIVYCLTIFTNSIGQIESYLEKEKIRYHSLTDLKTLLTTASERKEILPHEMAIVLDWMRNPADWDRIRRERVDEIVRGNKQKTAEILLDIKAVTLNPKQPYKYVSGILSPVYTDNRLLMTYPSQWKQVIDSFVSLIISKIGVRNVDVVCGTSMAGIPHAAYLAEVLNLPMVYIKSKKEEYGKFTIIEGRLSRNDKAIIIEDLISTGMSSISAARAVREAGGVVENCLAILTYGMKESEENFAKEQVNLLTLTDLPALLEVAMRKKFIEPHEKETILEWIRSPREWKGPSPMECGK